MRRNGVEGEYGDSPVSLRSLASKGCRTARSPGIRFFEGQGCCGGLSRWLRDSGTMGVPRREGACTEWGRGRCAIR